MARLFRVMTGIVCLAATVTGQARLPRPTPEGVATQITALSSADASARAIAACHLAWMGRRAVGAIPALTRVLTDNTAIPPVVCRIDGSGFASVRGGATTSPALEAARALGQIADEASVDALLGIAKSPIAAMRAEAALGLGRQRAADALPMLRTLLRDGDAAVRREAVTAVSRFRDAADFDALLALVDDPSILVRERAVIGIGNFRDPRSVQPLIGVLKDPDPALRELAVVALGGLRDARVADPLIAALQDPDSLVREQAARALSRLPRR